MQKVVASLVCGAALLLAGDPWKDKKSDDWTEKDVAKILTNSPWAKSLTLGGSTAISGLGNAGGVFGGSQTPLPGPKITVRWESAGPTLEAFHGSRYELLERLRSWSPQYYVITAPGMPVLAAEGIMKLTSLKRKGKEPIAPARVEILNIDGEVVPVFLFSRKDHISEEDKEITFESSAGSDKVKVKFDLKDMRYEGKLAL
jgi:hypothetical protein